MAKIAYDEHYKDANYFGNPYKGLIRFFEHFEPKGTVLDLGCGQGRDTIPLAKMGYNVIAVDHSKVGIDQLTENAKKANLNIQAIVGDVFSLEIDQVVDIILLDSMLHFYKNDVERESTFVTRILNEIKVNGVFVNFIIKGKMREAIIKDLVNKSGFDWEVLAEEYVDYPESNSKYHMLAVRKLENVIKR